MVFREYYDLVNDPNENSNLLGDGTTSNDPPATQITSLTNLLNTYASCSGTACVR